MPLIHPAVPIKQKAIVGKAPGQLVIKEDVLVPTNLEDMLLVKTVAVAINPSDAKMVDYSCTVGATSGYDFSGTVVLVGSSPSLQSHFQVGDRVCGGVHGMNALEPENGAFAQYVRANPNLTLKIPDSMSFEDAATLGTGLSTTGLTLFKSLGIPDTPDKPAQKPYFVLVYGGSSATGTMALQLLKLYVLTPQANTLQSTPQRHLESCKNKRLTHNPQFQIWPSPHNNLLPQELHARRVLRRRSSLRLQFPDLRH